MTSSTTSKPSPTPPAITPHGGYKSSTPNDQNTKKIGEGVNSLWQFAVISTGFHDMGSSTIILHSLHRLPAFFYVGVNLESTGLVGL
jgi:hypothetical protein